jgi:hypothetical protein
MQGSSILKNAGSQMTNKKRPIAVVSDVEDESDSKTFPRIKASMANIKPNRAHGPSMLNAQGRRPLDETIDAVTSQSESG